MPSPLAHAAAGYVAYRLLRSTETAEPGLLPVTILFSMLPDIDAVAGLAQHDFGRYHNNVSHSLGFVMGAGLLAGTLLSQHQGGFGRGFAVGSLACGLHVVLDYWATRRGILLFWPFSKRRFKSPKRLFYGFQWGRGIWSKTHILTAVTEGLFGLALVSTIRWLTHRSGS